MPPVKDDPTTKTFNKKEYHWCIKCRDGEGLWALHTTDQHKGYTPKSTLDSKNEETKSTKSNSKVTFSDKDDDSSPKVQVNNKVLQNARALMAQFKSDNKPDF